MQWANVTPEYDPTGMYGGFRKGIDLDGAHWGYEVDHSSQEHRGILRLAFEETDCFALVYSATSLASFNRIRKWKSTLDALLESPHPAPAWNKRRGRRPLLVALIETKCDLNEARKVEPHNGVQLAQELGCSFFQTSARTGYNVDAVFKEMGKAYRDVGRPSRS